jgi:hypothetical protein
LGQKTHIIDRLIKLCHKMELLGVGIELEGGNQRTHDLMENVGLRNQSFHNMGTKVKRVRTLL